MVIILFYLLSYLIIKLIMMSSRFDPGLTSVRPQKPWTSPFYGSINGLDLKTLLHSPICTYVQKLS